MGAVKLDNYTFDKVLELSASTGSSLLVKFDKSYAYGEKQDEFKLLCKQAYSVKNFIVGEVPVQEYGDKENSDLAEKFGVKKDDWPVYYLFSAEEREGVKYTGSIKAADLGAWLRRNKVKMPAIGTIGELDEIVQAWLKNDLADSHVQAAKEIAEGSYKDDPKAAMYIRIMEKVKSKGEIYVADETKRVGKILEGKVHEEKKAELTDKLKVLAAFQREEL